MTYRLFIKQPIFVFGVYFGFTAVYRRDITDRQAEGYLKRKGATIRVRKKIQITDIYV